MSDTKFTSGPWVAEEPMGSDAGDDLSIVEANKPTYEWRTIALVCSDDPDEETDLPKITVAERDANARLIAAAPELYEALREARDLADMAVMSDDQDGTPSEDQTALIKLRQKIDAALAKARGE